jgi:hypothetical protein
VEAIFNAAVEGSWWGGNVNKLETFQFIDIFEGRSADYDKTTEFFFLFLSRLSFCFETLRFPQGSLTLAQGLLMLNQARNDHVDVDVAATA